MRDATLSELDLAGVLWRHKIPLVACVVFAAALGYGLSQLLPVRYTAESRVFLSSAAPFDPLGQRSSGNQQRYVVQQAELMSSRAVLDRVSLPVPAPRGDLADAIEITPSADSDLVTVTATADAPELAAALADGVAVAFQSFTAELVADEAQRAVAAVSDEKQAEQILAAAAVYGDGVSVVDRADVPSSPSQPNPLRNAALLAMLGALVYAAVALLLEGRETWVDDDDEDEDEDDSAGHDRPPAGDTAEGAEVVEEPVTSGTTRSSALTPATDPRSRVD